MSIMTKFMFCALTLTGAVIVGGGRDKEYLDIHGDYKQAIVTQFQAFFLDLDVKVVLGVFDSLVLALVALDLGCWFEHNFARFVLCQFSTFCCL